jgi:eukaryotic-like serine/threonine-protein kinase
VSLSVSDFWRLLADSRLLVPQQVQQLAGKFGQVEQSAEPTAKSLAQWLVSCQVVSRYQAGVLLAGRSGPFFYGDYKVVDRTAQGRLAGCFRAVHTATGHPVLLKFLTGVVNSNPQLWAEAARNTAAAADIDSPHVQRFFEAVELQKFKFLVSEDVRGSTLDEKLASGRLPSSEACHIARLAALGLARMHASGRVHGDLRPANVLLEPIAKQPTSVKLLFDAHETPLPIDFADQQPSGRLATMADYLAPEMWTPGRAPDALTDLYAVGCTLYFMLAGSPPFAGDGVQEKFARHTSQPVQPLEPLGVPQPLAQLVCYLMAKNPTVRSASAQRVAEQLAQFVEPAALHWPAPAPPATLAAYEQAIRSKQPQPTAATALPQVVVGASSTGITVQPKARPARSAEEILLRRKQQRQRNRVLGLAATGALAFVLAGFGMWWAKYRPEGSIRAAVDGGASSVATGAAPQVSPAGSSGNASDVTKAAASTAAGSGLTAGATKGSSLPGDARQQIVPDDGKTLWAAPTSGQPVTFRCVPPEGQVFVILRPAALLAEAEGERVLAALGPAMAIERKAWEAASGFGLNEVEQLHMTLHNNDAKFPRASYVVKTKEAFTPEQLVAKWGNPAPAKEKEETYYTGPTWAYYIPSSGHDERTFAMGKERDMQDVAAAAGSPPAVFPQIERLRRATDNERHFTLLFYPQFLFNDDGEPLFAGERAKTRQPLAWLLGDHLRAASLSGFLAQEFYFEMRMLASLDKEPYQLAQELRDRLNKVPAALEDYFVSLDPPPYWKKLAFRYPGMARELHSQLRIGVENDQAIVNAVLPATAAHNLVLGGELLVSTSPGNSAAVAGPSAASGPQTIADALQLKTTYRFDQQSLEFAVRDLAEDVQGNLKNAPVEFAIKIIGDDLKLDGITRNQSIRDFQQESQTVADILTALVRKANPVTTVKDPSEADQKLVWVIGPDPDSPGKQTVLITTRAAAVAKKYTLPPPFNAKK